MIACLLIHGYTGGPYEIEPLSNFLKEETNWHIEVPTLPGHGRKLALENVSHKKWISAAEDSLNQLLTKYDEVYLIGFSMGGMIASYLAAKYKVDKLVLLASARKYLSFKQIILDIHQVCFDGLTGNIKKDKLYIHYKKKFGSVPFRSNLEFLKLVKFTKPYLKEIDSTVLIAQGQKDGMVPYKTAYFLDKEINSEEKEVVFFERSRHLICLGEDKDTLNQMIYNFLTKKEAHP